jgi:hypothetical protein
MRTHATNRRAGRAEEVAAIDAADGKGDADAARRLSAIEAKHCRCALTNAMARNICEGFRTGGAVDAAATAASSDAAEQLQAWMPTASLGNVI